MMHAILLCSPLSGPHADAVHRQSGHPGAARRAGPPLVRSRGGAHVIVRSSLHPDTDMHTLTQTHRVRSPDSQSAHALAARGDESALRVSRPEILPPTPPLLSLIRRLVVCSLDKALEPDALLARDEQVTSLADLGCFVLSSERLSLTCFSLFWLVSSSYQSRTHSPGSFADALCRPARPGRGRASACLAIHRP
jgi:hypothetical protein